MILYSLRLSQHSVLSWSLGREEVATSPIGNSSMIFLKLTFRREVGFYVLQVRVEHSHWSRSIEILCSDWLGSLCCYASSLRQGKDLS